jgi:dynein heavy chain, axonemal
MFLDTFNFYKGYNIPNLKTVEDYRASIETLPLSDTPDVFGLHPNADISTQTKQSQQMLGIHKFNFRNYHVHSTKR